MSTKLRKRENRECWIEANARNRPIKTGRCEKLRFLLISTRCASVSSAARNATLTLRPSSGGARKQTRNSTIQKAGTPRKFGALLELKITMQNNTKRTHSRKFGGRPTPQENCNDPIATVPKHTTCPVAHNKKESRVAKRQAENARDIGNTCTVLPCLRQSDQNGAPVPAQFGSTSSADPSFFELPALTPAVQAMTTSQLSVRRPRLRRCAWSSPRSRQRSKRSRR